MESQKNYKVIFQKYLDNQCSPQEVDWLLDFLKSNQQEENILQILEQHLFSRAKQTNGSHPLVMERLQMRLDKIIKEIEQKESTPVIPFTKAMAHGFKWNRIVAAAVFIIFLGFGTYYLLNHTTSNEIAVMDAMPIQDIAAPISTHATITLANGKKIILDSTGKGFITMEGDVNIKKLTDGEITYSGSSKEVVYNTLTNPRGSKNVTLTLSDGSKVWLNAGSSLKYPTAFAGSERKVEVTGEAYFEVTHNAKMPFRVLMNNDTEVEVLGTSFNVNAYDDEATANTTLLKGSVRMLVNQEGKQEGRHAQSPMNIILKPGEQAQILNASGLSEKPGIAKRVIKVIHADTDKVMAWKNGLFNFNGLTFDEIMRQLERWYDIRVVYASNRVPDTRLAGEMTRDVPLNDVLKYFNEIGIHYRLDNRTLIITP